MSDHARTRGGVGGQAHARWSAGINKGTLFEAVVAPGEGPAHVVDERGQHATHLRHAGARECGYVCGRVPRQAAAMRPLKRLTQSPRRKPGDRLNKSPRRKPGDSAWQRIPATTPNDLDASDRIGMASGMAFIPGVPGLPPRLRGQGRRSVVWDLRDGCRARGMLTVSPGFRPGASCHGWWHV